MDSGLLSLAPIIQASRSWICIRPLTYESKTEADYLRKVFSPRGGLENTVFALMDPGATRYLTRTGRGPYEVWWDCFDKPQAMVDGLAKLAAEFKPSAAPSSLPVVSSVRLALNVAACDNRPLAICYSLDTSARAKVAEGAWSESMLGQFVYVETSDRNDLAQVAGFDGAEGVYFVQPDEFGSKGTVFASWKGGDVLAAMTEAVSRFKPIDQSDHRGHLARGVRQKMRWRTAIPVEDRQAEQATQRMWGG